MLDKKTNLRGSCPSLLSCTMLATSSKLMTWGMEVPAGSKSSAGTAVSMRLPVKSLEASDAVTSLCVGSPLNATELLLMKARPGVLVDPWGIPVVISAAVMALTPGVSAAGNATSLINPKVCCRSICLAKACTAGWFTFSERRKRWNYILDFSSLIWNYI